MTDEDREIALQVYRALGQIENGVHALRVILAKELGLQPKTVSDVFENHVEKQEEKGE